MTSPNSRWWDNSPSGLTIDQISTSGPAMTFVAGALPQLFETQVYELLLLDKKPANIEPVNFLLT